MRIVKIIATILVLSAIIFGLYQFVIMPLLKTPARIAHMIDPDSYLVLIDGKIKKVQLIGINAPEEAGPKQDIHQCYAPEARKKTSETLLKGQKYIQLASDSTLGEKDVHGRLLRYVTLTDGRVLNEELLKAGLAKEFHPEDKKYDREEHFLKDQEEAKATSKGLWGAAGCAETL